MDRVAERDRLGGVLAAAVTPLLADGSRPDQEGIRHLVELFVSAGLDGVLVLGTTGEGIMLDRDERLEVADAFLREARRRLRTAVHCGAQTTRETVALASHAADAGADAVAVIAPPYYAFDAAGLLRHFEDAASACAPVPFYVYEFADRSGYAVPPSVLLTLRERAENLVGLKVSDAPLDRFERYLFEGLDVFVGPEALILSGLERGAVGAISGLASVFPELVVELFRRRDPVLGRRVGELREALQRFPVPAVLKSALAERGVPVTGAVRAPLRELAPREMEDLRSVLSRVGPAIASWRQG